MAAVFKKVLYGKTKHQSSKQKNAVPTPQCPPSPDLSGLTENEIEALRDVFRRQEQFEQEELERIQKLKDELEEFESSSKYDTNAKNKLKHIDLRLCRLCHKTKFADGIGRLCCDCHKRVCNKCGSFSPPRWNHEKNKNVQGRWRCNICYKRREVFCRTGEWHPAHRSLESAQTALREQIETGEMCLGDPYVTSSDSDVTRDPDENIRHQEASPDRDDITYHEPPHRRHHRRSLSPEDTLTKTEPESSDNENISRYIHEAQSKTRRTRRRSGKNYMTRYQSDRDSKQSLSRDGSLHMDAGSGNNNTNAQNQTVCHTEISRSFQDRNDKHQSFRRNRLTSFSDEDIMSRNIDQHYLDPEISDNSSDSGCVQELRNRKTTLLNDSALSIGGMSRIQRQDAMYYSSSSSIVSDTRSAEPSSHSPSSILLRESTGSSGSLPHLPETTATEIVFVNKVAPSIHVTSQFDDRDDCAQHSINVSPVQQGRQRELAKISKNHLSPKRHISPKRSKLMNKKASARRMTLPKCDQILLQNPDARRSSMEGDTPREIILHRDKSNRSCRTSGLGIRVIGGKHHNGSLCAYVASVVSDGPGYIQGIREGDQILQWNGRSLLNATFEEAREIMDQFCDVVQLIVIHKHAVRRKKPSRCRRREPATIDVPNTTDTTETDNELQPFSLNKPKRRMLPKTPLEIKKCERKLNGRIEVQFMYSAQTRSLKINILQAEMLSEGGENTGREPNPLAMIYILPCRNALLSCETETLFNTSSPKWNQTFVFEDIEENEVLTKTLEITLWNKRELQDQFLGEVLLDLHDANLDDDPVWYNLEDHDENSSPLPQRRISFPYSSDMSTATSGATSSVGMTPSPNREASPSTTSISHQYHIMQRSADNSPLSHGRARDHSSSGHSSPIISPDSPRDLPFPVSYRNSFTDKIRRTVSHAVHKMSSNLSLSDHKRDYDSDAGSLRRSSDESRPSRMKDNVSPMSRRSAGSSANFDMMAPPFPLSRTNSFSSFFTDNDSEVNDDPSNGNQNSSICRMTPEGDDITSILGPGQVKPKPSQEQSVQGDLKLGFMVTKGQLEVDVISAKSLSRVLCPLPPDTYVKTYLVEGAKIIQKKKTHIVKSNFNPIYRRKIKYSACNIHGRYMRLNIWARTKNFDRKICLGEAMVKLDTLDLSQHTMGWYKLFQMGSMDFGSCESLSFW
ncbi:hypothetical protein ScPMuIL_000290 [Solemya velum]